jgi:hypothetical protein
MSWLGTQDLTLAIFGAVPQQLSSAAVFFQIAAQGAVSRRSLQPETQSELKLAID